MYYIIYDISYNMPIISGINSIQNTNIFVSKIYPSKIIKVETSSNQVKKYKKPSGPALQLTIINHIVDKIYKEYKIKLQKLNILNSKFYSNLGFEKILKLNLKKKSYLNFYTAN